MKVNDPKFVKSTLQPDYPRDGRPEVAFVGRSIGKSSLLNTLLNRRGLAKTSATPGKTQTLNFFDLDGRCYFVDLPGYGFAKVPLGMKQHWNVVMREYLAEREPLRLVVALVDARHKPTENDSMMLDLLEEAQKPTVVVATKWDKLRPSQQQPAIKLIQSTLELDEEALILPSRASPRIG